MTPYIIGALLGSGVMAAAIIYGLHRYLTGGPRD